MEINPSDVGSADRLVIQELIKEMAQTQQIDANATRKFKSKISFSKKNPEPLTLNPKASGDSFKL